VSLYAILIPLFILLFELRYPHPRDRKTGTGTPSSRSRLLLFRICSDFFNEVCSSAQLASTLYRFLDIFHLSMMVFKIPLVIPTRVSWLVLILLVGICGLFAQVFSSIPFLFLSDLGHKIAKVLLAMGFQRETASRGSLSLCSSVRVPPLRSWHL
jgi:hypothetical protein